MFQGAKQAATCSGQVLDHHLCLAAVQLLPRPPRHLSLAAPQTLDPHSAWVVVPPSPPPSLDRQLLRRHLCLGAVRQQVELRRRHCLDSLSLPQVCLGRAALQQVALEGAFSDRVLVLGVYLHSHPPETAPYPQQDCLGKAQPLQVALDKRQGLGAFLDKVPELGVSLGRHQHLLVPPFSVRRQALPLLPVSSVAAPRRPAFLVGAWRPAAQPPGRHRGFLGQAGLRPLGVRGLDLLLPSLSQRSTVHCTLPWLT